MYYDFVAGSSSSCTGAAAELPAHLDGVAAEASGAASQRHELPEGVFTPAKDVLET